MNITILTPVKNGQKTLDLTINSILNQSYLPYEYIIIVGESNDKTVEVANSFTDRFKNLGVNYLVLLSNDKSMYEAINLGIIKSKGEIIGVLNSGDLYLDNTLEVVKRALEASNLDGLHSNYFYRFEKKNRIIDFQFSHKKKSLINRGCVYLTPTIFLKRKVFNEIGLYLTDFKIVSDWEFQLRLINCNVELIHLNEPIMIFNHGGLSTSNSYKYIFERHLLRKKYIDKFSFLFLFSEVIYFSFKKIIFALMPNLIILDLRKHSI